MRKLTAIILVIVMLLSISVAPTAYAADASDIIVSQEYDIDVVLSVGNATTNINTFNDDLKAALVAKGVPEKRIRISSVQATTSSTDSMNASDIVNGWQARPIGTEGTTALNKDEDYSARYAVDNINNRIYSTVSSGRPAAVYFNPNGFNTRNATIEYTWGIVDNWTEIGAGTGSFSHGEAGFIFRMDPTRERFYTFTLDNHSACGNLSGYGVDGQAAEALLKFTNGSNNPSTKYPTVTQKTDAATTAAYSAVTDTQPAALRLNNFSAYALGRKEYVKIELNGSNIKVYRRINSNSGTNPAALDAQDPYSLIFDWTDESSPFMNGTYGFYVFDQDGAYFSDISLTTESTRNFSEIIREPEWRNSSKRFVVNLENNAIPDFSSNEKLGEILSRMGNDDIHYMGWGTTANQAEAEAFIEKNDDRGTFTLNTDYDQSIEDMADYIYSVYDTSKAVGVIYMDKDRPQELNVTPASEKNDTSDTDWPQGKWRITHDADHYENGEGVASFHNQYLDDLNVTFNKTGKYDVYYKDIPVKTVYAHKRPVASFTVALDGGRNVTLTDNSYDLDHLSEGDKGIAAIEYQWKESNAAAWTPGAPSGPLDNNKEYILQQRVQDEEGEWSLPYNRYISTSSASATLKAVPEFRMLKTTIFKNPGTAIINDVSYSPSGAITAREWTVQKNGLTIYTDANNPMTDFSAQDAGTYKIRLRVQNANGWSEPFSRYLTVVEDAELPAVSINPPAGTYGDVTNVVMSFSDAGGSNLDYQQYAVTGDTNVPGIWSGKSNNESVSISLDELGTYYIHYKAVDNSGNTLTGFAGPYRLVTALEADVAADKDALTIGYAPGDNANNVTQNVTLPLTGASGSTVTWSSNGAETVDAIGNVYRSTPAQGDTTVMLTATLRKGLAVDTKTFTLLVKALPATEEEAIAIDKATLSIGYASGDNASHITQDVILPANASNGSMVVWSSDTPGTIANDGTVTRPAYGSGDKTIILTATLTKNALTETRTYSVTVKEEHLSDAASVAADKAALEIGYAPGDRAAHVTRNVTLPTTCSNGSTVTWASDTPAVVGDAGAVADDGSVTRPNSNNGDDTEVALTATIQKGGESDTKTFNLTVIMEPADDAAAVADDTAALEIIYAQGDNQNSVTQNVTLPTVMGNGSTVTWASDNAAVATDGTVTRPSNGSSDATVNLTATITLNAESDTKPFTLLVKELPDTGADDVAADKAVLAVGYAPADDEDNVTQNVTLPGIGANGTTITWSSDVPGTIDALGNVFRPNHAQGDIPVVLTATISKNGAMDTITFPQLVKALSADESASAAYDKSVLEISYAPGDSDLNVTKDVTLPLLAEKGSTIIWTSDTPETVSDDGQVTRPAAGAQDKIIILTATITKGASVETKLFVLVVKAQTAVPNNDNSGSAPAPTPATTGVQVIVNGVVETAATETKKTVEGREEVAIDVNEEIVSKKMDQILAGTVSEASSDNVVKVPVNSTSAGKIDVGLNGEIVKKMEENDFKLEIQSHGVGYIIPADEMNINDIAERLNHRSTLKDIEITVQIEKINPSLTAEFNKKAEGEAYEIMLPPVNFNVVATSKTTGESVTVNQFTSYVQRIFEIPEGIDPNKITTGVVVDADGTVRHMPTVITVINDRYYAQVNSLSNSPYTVVWHPVAFTDVSAHWAKKAINDMGSRMVVVGDGKGSYRPDRNMTRAEFAAIMVKALGLKPGTGNDSYRDVPSSAWYSDYVETASSYGIIVGYGNGKFGPLDQITREQAMSMIARAMNITDLEVVFTNSEAASILSKYSDSGKAADYAKTSLAACVKYGIASGKGNSSIAPKDYVTRAEVAVMVRNLLVNSKLIDNR